VEGKVCSGVEDGGGGIGKKEQKSVRGRVIRRLRRLQGETHGWIRAREVTMSNRKPGERMRLEWESKEKSIETLDRKNPPFLQKDAERMGTLKHL
jgi:hypothetical protein